MNVLNRSVSSSAMRETDNTGAYRLRLYERYGAIAHGVILKIVRQPQQAQEVLVDVFASPELQTNLPFSASTTCAIIRLARRKALAYGQNQQLPDYKIVEPTQQPEHIFNLLFYYNQSPESIAEGLQMQRPAVFNSIREFFGRLSSHKQY